MRIGVGAFVLVRRTQFAGSPATCGAQLTVWLINRKSRRIALISYAGGCVEARQTMPFALYGKINRRSPHARDAIFVTNSKFTYWEINNCDVSPSRERNCAVAKSICPVEKLMPRLFRGSLFMIHASRVELTLSVACGITSTSRRARRQ